MTTLLTFRQRPLRSIGSLVTGTTSSAGAADGSTIVATSLKEYPDSTLKGWYVKTTSGSTQATKRIEDNDQDTGTVRVYSAFAAQIATAVTFELFSFDPANITTFINEAIDDAYPALCKPVIDDTLVSHNILVNSNFEDWTSSAAPDGHTVATATAVAEATIKLFGSYSLEMNTAAGSVYQTSDTHPHLRKLENSTITFYCWVNTAAASNARISVYTLTQDGTATTTYSSYHSGGGEFELLSVEAAIPDDLAEVKFSYVTATTDTAYFDNARCEAGWQEYLLPLQIDHVLKVYECNEADEMGIDSWESVSFVEIDKGASRYIRVAGTSGGKHLELVGYGKFASLSSDTDAITPITDAWERAICAAVTAKILDAHGSLLGGRDIESAMKLAGKYEVLFETLKEKNRMAVTAPKKPGSLF